MQQQSPLGKRAIRPGRHGAPMPRYVLGDGRRARELLPGEEGSFDMLLMCPPYYNLETFSTLAR